VSIRDFFQKHWNVLLNPHLCNIHFQNCKAAKCEPMTCVLEDLEMKTSYFVNITARIWNGTFAFVSVFWSVLLCPIADTSVYTHVYLLLGGFSDCFSGWKLWNRNISAWSHSRHTQTTTGQFITLSFSCLSNDQHFWKELLLFWFQYASCWLTTSRSVQLQN